MRECFDRYCIPNKNCAHDTNVSYFFRDVSNKESSLKLNNKNKFAVDKGY